MFIVNSVDTYLSIQVDHLMVLKNKNNLRFVFLLVLTETVIKNKRKGSQVETPHAFFQLSPIAQLVRAPH